MSVFINSIFSSVFLPKLHVNRSQTASSSYSSQIFANNALSWDNTRRMRKYYKTTRKFLVRSVVDPGAPMPPKPPFNFMNWIVGMAFTVVIPFLTHKWTSLLKIKNEVDTAVQTAEDIAEVVEKVTARVEKVAEDILDDLPEGGKLRKAVAFVEHAAERANRDAHALDDFIDKAQEVEDRIESLAEEAIAHKHNHKHQKEEEENTEVKEEEERAQELSRKDNIDDVDKH